MSKEACQSIAPEITAAASEWFARLQDGEASEQDFIDWQQWLLAHPDHSRAYREMEQAWYLIGKASPLPKLPPAKAPPKRLSHWPRALAASIVLGVFAAIAWYAMEPSLQSPAALVTGTAEQRSLRLSDGSRVTLGADSALELQFDAARRRVELMQGEAFFEVARDGGRPFTVMVGDSEVRAVGTAFNVHARADRMVVAVVSGRVQVSRAPVQGGGGTVAIPQSIENAVLLAAGERAMTDALGVHKLPSIEVDEAATWRQGRREYIGEELRHIVDDLNRYTDRDIVIADHSVGELRYSGTVFPDHLDEWLESLSGIFPVEVADVDDHREIVRARTTSDRELRPH